MGKHVICKMTFVFSNAVIIYFEDSSSFFIVVEVIYPEGLGGYSSFGAACKSQRKSRHVPCTAAAPGGAATRPHGGGRG